MTTATAPSPELFFQTLWAYQRTAAIRTAIELDVFSAIHRGARTAGAIAEECAASVRGTRILCDYLAMTGFLVKKDDQYDLTPDSATFLVKASPAYMGGVIGFLMSEAIVRSLDGLADTVRRGTVPPETNIVSEENPVWESFARAMVPMMGPAAQEMAGLLCWWTEPPAPCGAFSTSRRATGCSASPSPSGTRRPRSSPWTGRGSWRWRPSTRPAAALPPVIGRSPAMPSRRSGGAATISRS
jgi:hypothetical protein